MALFFFNGKKKKSEHLQVPSTSELRGGEVRSPGVAVPVTPTGLGEFAVRRLSMKVGVPHHGPRGPFGEITQPCHKVTF